MLIPENYYELLLIWKMKFFVRRAGMICKIDKEKNQFECSNNEEYIREIIQVEISQEGYRALMKYFIKGWGEKFKDFLNSYPSQIQKDIKQLMEDEEITEALSSGEEKLNKELEKKKTVAITFSNGRDEELIDTVQVSSKDKVMERLIEIHPELDSAYMLRGCKFNIYELKESFIKLDTKILLVSKASGNNYSLEAGIHDGVKNFDHHGEYENEDSPCINDEIREVHDDEVIEISHMDCDTWIGLLRMIDRIVIPKNIDYSIINEIDLNGSISVIRRIKESSNEKDRVNNERALFYYLGVGVLARKINFPRVTSNPQDVTEYIKKMLMYSVKEIILMGKEIFEKNREEYKKCFHAWDFLDKSRERKIGLFYVNKDDSFDPSQTYGYEIVVVYRSHWRTVSIYCDPKSQYEFAGKTIEGILFQRHPKACGSPRGVEMTEKDGKRVFNEIIDNGRRKINEGKKRSG